MEFMALAKPSGATAPQIIIPTKTVAAGVNDHILMLLKSPAFFSLGCFDNSVMGYLLFFND